MFSISHQTMFEPPFLSVELIKPGNLSYIERLFIFLSNIYSWIKLLFLQHHLETCLDVIIVDNIRLWFIDVLLVHIVLFFFYKGFLFWNNVSLCMFSLQICVFCVKLVGSFELSGRKRLGWVAHMLVNR